MAENGQSAAIFDRDGTLIRDCGYLADPDQIELLDGVRETLSLLRESGYKLAIVSNQSGIGRGYFSELDVDNVHARLQELLGLSFDAFYYCPHIPEDACACRKPSPVLLKKVLAELECGAEHSFYAGDKRSDMEAARAAGLTSIWCNFSPGHYPSAQDLADIEINRFSDLIISIKGT